MSAWPSTLPQQFDQDGYAEQLPSGLLRSEMDVGPAKVRLRYTAAVTPFTGTFSGLTTAQVATLDEFWRTTTGFGSLAFTWAHPRTGTAVSCRFTEAPKVEADSSKWKAIISIEVLP